MPATTPHVEPTATMPRLLLVMSAGVIGFGVLEVGLLAIGAWWVLPVLMVTLVLATFAVILAVMRAMEGYDGGPRAVPTEPEAQPAAQPRAARAPASRLVPGH